MFRLTERGDWDRLATAMGALEPLLRFTDERRPDAPGEALRSAVRGQNAGETHRRLLWFAVAALEVHLADVVRVASLGDRRLAIRQGFAEYLAIEPRLRRAAFADTRLAGNLFRRLYHASGDAEQCRVVATELMEVLVGAVRVTAGEGQ